MEISKHGVGVPAAHEFDVSVVDFSTEERHRAACSERAGADVGGVDSGSVETSIGGVSQLLGDVDGSDAGTTSVVVVGGELYRRVKGQAVCSTMGSVRKHQADDCFSRAAKRMVAPAVRNGVAFSLVLLCSEIQADRRSSLEFVVASGGEVEAAVAEVKTDIVEGEGGAVVCCTGVFTGT